jgi:hypothetical protein
MSKSYKKYIKLFIPKIVFDHLQYKMMVNPPDFEYEVETFYSILNDLSNVKYYNDYTADNEMIPMYSKLLQKKYGNNYNLYIRYLNVNSIIYSSTFYTNEMCLYYGIVVNKIIEELLERKYHNTSYCLNIYKENAIQIIDINEVIKVKKRVKNMGIVVVKIPINCKSGKYITDQYNKELDKIKHYPPHIKTMAQYFKNTIGINYEEAMKYSYLRLDLDLKNAGDNPESINSAYNKHQHRLRNIIEINEGKKHLRFSRNRTNLRIDTNLTNMSKELRIFLHDYENMSYLDLSNSQPVLFNVMLNQYDTKRRQNLKAEIEEYKKVTIGGNWYEFLMNVFGINDREVAKEYWMQIAYSKNAKYRRIKNRFAKKFPQIMKIIESKKATDHASFSIALQKIESKIFIDEICKELVNSEIIPYTLHDGIMVLKKNEADAYSIMAKVLKKHLGAIPVISINNNKVYSKS